MELEEAKKVILEHLKGILAVKNTKWVFDMDSGGYKEVDAGYTEKEIEIMERYKYRDMKDYFKLRNLLEELI